MAPRQEPFGVVKKPSIFFTIQLFLLSDESWPKSWHSFLIPINSVGMKVEVNHHSIHHVTNAKEMWLDPTTDMLNLTFLRDFHISQLVFRIPPINLEWTTTSVRTWELNQLLYQTHVVQLHGWDLACGLKVSTQTTWAFFYHKTRHKLTTGTKWPMFTCTETCRKVTWNMGKKLAKMQV